ncbi:MAG: glycoside hydrolase family 3 N-terminal domain-containing protein [Ilumatobacteraceae bacterium]
MPTLDATAPIEERVQDLLSQMTLEEKVGQMFHTMVLIGPDGTLTGAFEQMGLPSPEDMVVDRQMTHFNLLGAATITEMAQWHNRLQALTRRTRLQIPITVSTDPRNAFTRNVGTGAATSAFSQWPEALGLAAIGDEELVERFTDICRQEYLSIGIRVALHPQLDVTTEPRWARIITTFGEDAAVVARLGAAYIRGFRGDAVGPQSVSTMIKHFPGGAPLKDGEDSHFPSGREQIYPGGNFEYHLGPFRAALAAGATQVMPSYGMPIDAGVEEIACGFNRDLIGRLLREELGFDGIVCTDWGLLNDAQVMGQVLAARAWGMEDATPSERALRALDAGVDQFGGEHCPDLIVELVRSGAVTEERIDVSVRRLLHEKFALGLFEQRDVDVERAATTAGTDEFRTEGHRAQSRSVTVLTNNSTSASLETGGRPTLPIVEGCRLHVEGIDVDVAARYGTVVASQAEADVSVIRIAAPYEPRPGRFERRFHSGSLEFADADLAAILATLHAGPTVVDVFLERPAVLADIVEAAAAVVVDYGCSDEDLLNALCGRVPPEGRLPVDLPRSMAAVVASRTDVAFDTEDPLFRHGHGLTI